jgi:hypothetical protein
MGRVATLLRIGRSFGMRDGMLRLRYELERGSGVMSRRMQSVSGWEYWTLSSITKDGTPQDLLAACLAGKRPFFFGSLNDLKSSLTEVVGAEGEARVLGEAENILRGNLPFFGESSFACGFPPDWFSNPATEQKVSAHRPWTQMRFASPAYGDLKFILEPSRFLFAYPLVRAYALSGDERFPEAFWTAIESWARNSPPMAGPLWICGQESALRILAWSFALYGFLRSPATTKDRASLLLSMIAASAWRTAQTIGYARSQRSNHLVSEAVGLWTVGTLYPELKSSTAWQRLGANLLREAVVDQITPEGASQQHSFNYQRMVLQLLFWSLRLAEIQGAHLDDVIRLRATAALEFISAWTDPISGNAPKYGADDGTLILPLTLCEYGDFRPLLQMGASVLNRPGLAPGPWDEAPLWLGAKAPTAQRAQPPSVPSVNTGYHRLGDDTSWALVRAGKYRRRPFHSDQLHVDLWWRGTNFAKDAGTYLYNGDPPWNNGLACTAVHNTVTVDGRDQMRRAGRFLWVDWAQAEGHSYASHQPGPTDCFEGEHDGYRRLGVTHRRAVRWFAGTGWVIVDDLLGGGEHDLHLHWLVPTSPFEFSPMPYQVVFKSPDLNVSWNIFASSPGTPSVIESGKIHRFGSGNTDSAGAVTDLLGWHSSSYGRLNPAISLLYSTRGLLPVRFVTIVLLDQESRIETEYGQAVIRSVGSEVYRVSLSGPA